MEQTSGIAFHRPQRAMTAEDQRITDTAQKFESIFIAQLLKSAAPARNNGGLFGSDALRQYESLRDTYLASQISKSGSFGLADRLATHLKKGSGK